MKEQEEISRFSPQLALHKEAGRYHQHGSGRRCGGALNQLRVSIPTPRLTSHDVITQQRRHGRNAPEADVVFPRCTLLHAVSLLSLLSLHSLKLVVAEVVRWARCRKIEIHQYPERNFSALRCPFLPYGASCWPILLAEPPYILLPAGSQEKGRAGRGIYDTSHPFL